MLLFLQCREPFAGAVYAIFQQYVPKPKATDAKAKAGGDTPRAKAIAAGMRWMPCGVEPSTGILRPPQWYQASGSGYGAIPSGAPNTTWFADTEIYSEADCDPWIAIGADDDAHGARTPGTCSRVYPSAPKRLARPPSDG